MIISTNTSIGIQCSKCGELQFRTLSLFSFSHFTKQNFFCTCGAPLLIITKIDRSNYCIEYPCIYCGEFHYILSKRFNIWGSVLLEMTCPDKSLAVGYIGTRTKVENSCKDIKKNFLQFASQLVNDEETEVEFDNFFVVYALMEKLCVMAEKDLLGCKCGNNNLAVEILSDRIELICEECKAAGVIYTDNGDIIKTIENMDSIFLEERTTWLVNQPYKGHNLVKNK